MENGLFPLGGPTEEMARQANTEWQLSVGTQRRDRHAFRA
jgi:hypothetical protein